MLKIKLIQPQQVEEVTEVILEICQEVFQVDRATILNYDDFVDLDNVEEHYFTNRGIFLVLLDRQKVVGSGAIRYLENDICELKRMWIFQAYRGQGWGKKISEQLFAFAKKKGYKKIRLDLANTEKQQQAIAFYKNLGFYSIPPYNSSPCQVFMEKNI